MADVALQHSIETSDVTVAYTTSMTEEEDHRGVARPSATEAGDSGATACPFKIEESIGGVATYPSHTEAGDAGGVAYSSGD